MNEKRGIGRFFALFAIYLSVLGTITMKYSLIRQRILFYLKPITTLAVTMIKYVFCILIGIFLIYRADCTALAEENARLPAGVAVTPISQCAGDHSLFNDQTADSKVSDAILPHGSFSRELGSSKVLKLKLQTTIRLFNTFHIRQLEKGDAYPGFNHNLIKYSSGYYVYSLGHILI